MNKEILRLAVPNILSNISIPLLSTVDTILMGHLSASHIGAVGLGAIIFNFVYWNFGFLRMGTTGITAQAYGREDQMEISSTFWRSVLIALLLAGGLLLLQVPFGNFAFWAMQVSDSQSSMVADYFYTRIWAAPATFLLYAIFGWFFGMQNAIYPLILTIFINILNIIANLYFVYHLNMEVEGVALGTVVAQYAGLLLAIVFLLYKYKDEVTAFGWEMVLKASALKQFLIINRDIFLRTICLTSVFAFFHSASSQAGETILAINIILLQLLNWMSYGVDGFAFAAESLVGKYFGKKDKQGLSKIIRHSLFWGGVLALLYSLVYGVFGKSLIHIFTDIESVRTDTYPYLWWMVLIPFFGAGSYIWDGIFIGLTASKSMRDSMALSFVIFCGTYYFLSSPFGNHGLWASLLIFLMSRTLIQTIMYQRKGSKLS